MPKAQADDYDRKIGRKIQRERERQEIGRPTLGNMVGLSAMGLYKYEIGSIRITVSALAKIAKALKKPVADFLPRS